MFFWASALLVPLPDPKPYSLLMEDRRGVFLHAFLANDGIWRLKTSPDEIPDKLKQILIQKEDRFFYYHPGVNPFSLGRALVHNVLGGRRVSGASTITMQVARLLEPKQRTYINKLVEMFRAVQLEMKYTKDEILELYLSMVPLGGNIEGLKSAAMIYYQTPLERLNIAQLFDLILIPNDPNKLRPDRNAERLYAERIFHAQRWLRMGFLSSEDSVVLWHTDARARRSQLPRLAPHFSLRVREHAGDIANVRSSLDIRTQRKVETLLANHLRHWKLKGVQNGAVVVIENRTREIVGYAGSGDFDDETSKGQVDAVKALRSPGSTLKPFLYALEMDRGILTPKSRLLDIPYDAEGFQAENYDGLYSGLVYADEALRRSLNVPMIRILQQAGVRQFVDFAKGTGINSLSAQKEKLGLSVILGGCGVTLEEMTAAYATFPNNGIYAKARYVHDRNRVYGREAFSPSTAYMITDILSGLDRPDLPNNFESSLNLPKIAYKTGTSYGRRDAWSIGYSAEYTVGVWIGNVTNSGNPDLTGSKAAAPLLVDIFNTISTPHLKTILPVPRDIRMREVCAHSGHVPTPRCEHLVYDYYSRARTVVQLCTADNEYLVSPDGNQTFCHSCLGKNNYVVISITDYPAELLGFWKVVGKSFAKAPPHNPACTRLFAGDGPTIISPSQEMTYYLVSPQQQITLHATSGQDVNEHIWYLDDRYLSRNRANEKLFLRLIDGDHTVACVDDKGRMSSVRIRVKAVL